VPMPVNEFEEAEDLPIDKPKTVGKNQDAIHNFLEDNKELAFTQTEIQQELEISKPACVYVALHALLRKDKITRQMINKIIYWAIKEEKT